MFSAAGDCHSREGALLSWSSTWPLGNHRFLSAQGSPSRKRLSSMTDFETAEEKSGKGETSKVHKKQTCIRVLQLWSFVPSKWTQAPSACTAQPTRNHMSGRDHAETARSFGGNCDTSAIVVRHDLSAWLTNLVRPVFLVCCCPLPGFSSVSFRSS